MDSSLDRLVALKLIKTTLDEETNARFQREARTTAKLSHPNIVSIHDMGTQDSHPYLVIEYVEGKSLDDLIRENGPLSLSEILRISKSLASAYREAKEPEKASEAVNRSIELFTTANASFYVEKALAMKELLKA